MGTSSPSPTKWPARFGQIARALFSYHAVTDKQRRQPPVTYTESEDKSLPSSDRKKLTGTLREARRNQALLAWMVRQDADFCAKFRFQSLSPSKGVNATLERLVRERSQPDHCDVTGRHDLDRFLRLLQIARTTDGDVGVLWLPDGRLQAIEGDRIATPTRNTLPTTYADWSLVHGVHCDDAGRPLHYCVCTREPAAPGGQGLSFDRMVAAEDLYLLGYWDRFDSVRGVSPLICCANHTRDLYEEFEYLHTKVKNHALLGCFIKSAPTEGGSGWTYADVDTGDAPTAATERYQFDLRPGLKIEGAPGDSIDTIESHTPSDEFLEFTRLQVRLALLALDIPFVFFDSRGSTYSAYKVDLDRYQRAVESRRADLRLFLDEMLRRDIARWRQSGELVLANIEPSQLRWDWLAEGTPWINPLQEVQADMLAVSAGFQTRDDVVARTSGRRFEDVVANLGKEEAAAVEASATIGIGQPGQITTREEETGAPESRGMGAGDVGEEDTGDA